MRLSVYRNEAMGIGFWRMPKKQKNKPQTNSNRIIKERQGKNTVPCPPQIFCFTILFYSKGEKRVALNIMHILIKIKEYGMQHK